MHFYGFSDIVRLCRPEVPSSIEHTATLSIFGIIKQYLHIGMKHELRLLLSVEKYKERGPSWVPFLVSSHVEVGEKLLHALSNFQWS